MRERQDLVGEWQAKDKLLIAAKSQEPGKRNAGAEKALADRLGAIDARLAEIGRKLAKDFPDYAALASPAPVSVADVQAQLGADEALVLFLDTDDRFKPLPEETFVWVVTRSEVRWVRSELGTAALQREVAALRCGLDSSLWDDKDKRARCVELLKAQRYDDRANVLPFPVARAHALYKALLGEVEDLIAGKHLLIVPSGALTQLPFQVLVTAPPKAAVPEEVAGYRETAWLGARQPITVLPAVSSLKALRAHAKASRAGKVYLGIGNPLLDGPDARYAELAKKARASKSCPVAPTPVATLDAGQGGVAPVEIRGGLANVADIRTQTPLPETADELCAVARDLKADVSEVRLGDRATETEVKRLSKSGELARYRVLHFATHGAMAGELSSAREPGLILTPPEKASEEDDGYLSASEIAAPQARRRLGDPVGLQHRRAGSHQRRGPLRHRPRLHLRRGARAAGLALGGLLRCHRQTHHHRRRRDGARSQRRPRRGHATRDAGSHRQGPPGRGAPGLLGAVRGRGRGRCGTIGAVPPDETQLRMPKLGQNSPV